MLLKTISTSDLVRAFGRLSQLAVDRHNIRDCEGSDGDPTCDRKTSDASPGEG